MTYREFVKSQRRNNPCLAGLDRFFSGPDLDRSRCRILSLTFPGDGKSSKSLHEFLEIEDLPSAIYYNRLKGTGRILVIEDLCQDIIELLGTACKIDPLFFASHLHAPFRDMDAQTPNLAILPSRMRQQNFINTHYHRTIEIQENIENVTGLVRDMNVSRKVSVLAPLVGRRVSLIQHACSVLLFDEGKPEQGWLCMYSGDICGIMQANERVSHSGIILVDPPLVNGFISVRHDYEKQTASARRHISCRLSLNGYEDFLEPQLTAFGAEYPCIAPSRDSLLDDLVYYWDREPPPSFDRRNPTLLALSYYPLKIVAAEWVTYMAAMSSNIKGHEYAVEKLRGHYTELDILNVDLRSLQIWRRRSLASQQKITAIKRFIILQEKKAANDLYSDDCAALLDDFEYLSRTLSDYSIRLENMLPVVTSLVQISDSRRSLAESVNISRLTSLAFIFVPLTFTTGLFSMNTINGPGGKYFWVYFAVAIPVTLLVFIIARPPAYIFRWLYAHLRSDKATQTPV